jgi:transcriptional regulator with XRE-family HTH domain
MMQSGDKKIVIIVIMHWKQKLGQELRKARESKGMTQQELREELLRSGLSLCLPTIGYYERGERAPDFGDLRNFAAVLKTDHFQIDEHVRIEFNRNGKPRPGPVAQQLTLKFEDGESVDVRIECKGDGLIIMKANRG